MAIFMANPPEKREKIGLDLTFSGELSNQDGSIAFIIPNQFPKNHFFFHAAHAA
jgi:hypothetical protein